MKHLMNWQKTNKGKAMMVRKNTLERQRWKKRLDGKLDFSADIDEATIGNAHECSTLNMSYGMPNWVRLLDEGVIIECDGSIDSVIAKGAIKRWFEALPDDYEGNIDKDHNRSIDLGTFTKDQLKLVDLGGGRYGIDVNVQLNTELHATQDLLLMDNRKAISSEFMAIEGYEVKASSILGDELDRKDYSVPVITEVALTGYGVVETPLNANSYNEQLLERAFSAKPIVEGTDMTEEELKAKAAAEAAEAAKNAKETEAKEKTEVPDGVGGEGEDNVEPETTDGDTKQKDASDVITESINECPEGEEETPREPNDETLPTPEGVETQTDASAEATLAELQTAIEGMKKDLAAKDAEIADLKSKLDNTKVVQNDFQSRLAKMLNFATSTEPTEAEGKDVTPAKKEEEEGDAVMKAYASAFKDLK